ncbi:ComF family protein [Patescibacteria group bacterium]|nr:ComF family protein [Patescibacteria group bacterium]MBU1457908.1 ComF family protein [Patescibacteria group bacterium]
MKWLVDWFVDFVYPKDCVGCGCLGTWLCDKCKRSFEEVEQICPMCGKENLGGSVHKMCSERLGMDGLTAVYNHGERTMSGLIFRVKFEYCEELLEEFVKLLDFEVGKKFDVVVPVPLHIYRRNWRGFNQARVIADEVGRQLGLPVVEGLRRVKRGKQQSKIKDREGRRENVKGVFKIGMDSRLRGNDGLKDKAVLLVDDVFTSGATMREACKVLKQAGAKFVWGLVLARRV